jgi:hypothetical protein
MEILAFTLWAVPVIIMLLTIYALAVGMYCAKHGIDPNDKEALGKHIQDIKDGKYG